ncbi:MAG: esterase-like activity of phytase family protein, partial [Pseudomonadota bacterium]
MESLFPLVASETLDVSSESIMTAEVLADEGADNDRRIVEDVEFLGVFEFPSLLEFESTTVGGLSGITYDPESETYFAVSDDRDAGEDGTPRVYEISIDLSDGTLDDGDVALVDVFALTQVDGTTTLDVINPDPEGIALDEMGQFYISSERDLNGDPAIFLFDETFSQIGELTVDDKFLPDGGGTAGVRNNLGFESLTITPDQTTLYTATESALVQDGEVASLETGSAARIIRYDLQTGEPTAEFIYEVDPIAAEPDPVDAFADSGLVELLALDNEGTLLALERSFSVGAEDRGYTGKLYLVRTQGATNVIDFDAVPTEIEDGELEINVDEVATKELLADLSEFDIVVDNVEGLAFG